MLYSGDVQDICCISCTPVKELKHPVGFDSSHAFECEAIVTWITTSRNTNPLTGEQLKHTPVATVLHPLIVDDQRIMSKRLGLSWIKLVGSLTRK